MSDRKYRHRGYQDDDHEERAPGKGSSPHPGRMDGAPRGRGLGLPSDVVFQCARCGKKVHDREIDFDTKCSSCSSPLHSCTNCKFFNSGARFECTRDILQRVETKSGANNCELWRPKTVRDLRPTSKTNDPRAAFDALFKK